MLEICGNTLSETTSRGVIVMYKNSPNIEVTNVIKDPGGNFILMEMNFGLKPLLLVGVYGPSDGDHDAFWESLVDEVELLGYENYLLIGDMNFVTDITLDWINHKQKVNDNPKTAKFFLNLFEEGRIFDAYRQLNPEGKEMSWRVWGDETQVSTKKK